MQRRIQKGFDVFEYYCSNQWDFDNANVLYMRSIINDVESKRYAIEDKRMFNREKNSFQTKKRIKKMFLIFRN